MPVLNEAPAIEESLSRLLCQTYQPQQILVADGGSTDGTLSILERLAAESDQITIILNEGRIQAAGLNECLVRATGDVIVRIDARSFVDPDYIERCLFALETSEAAAVGGRMVARRPAGLAARAIAVANGAPWGAGPARFHHSRKSGFVDTVYLGAFRRECVDEVGGWSVSVGVNEDAELNHRLRAQGHRIWFDGSITVSYQPRETFGALAKQYVRYGNSRAITIKRHPASVRLRQVLPAVLPVVLLLALVGGKSRSRLARRALVSHVVFLAAGASLVKQERALVRALSAFAAAMMHWSWSVGFWKGIVQFQGREPTRE
ncbi:MAG TPA: glycosyltransferase family 2 protein [Acidimicrobiales bacterium]|nr:glycosyltransferase family 2 protein [Acidimicrobiales bacterium]